MLVGLATTFGTQEILEQQALPRSLRSLVVVGEASRCAQRHGVHNVDRKTNRTNAVVSCFFSVSRCPHLRIFAVRLAPWALLVESWRCEFDATWNQRLLWLLTIWESSDQVIWNDPKCTKCMNSNFIDDYHRLSLHYMPLPLRPLYPWIISMAPRKLGLVPPSMRHGWHGLYLKARGEWYRCSMNHSSNRLTKIGKVPPNVCFSDFHTNVASEFQNQKS